MTDNTMLKNSTKITQIHCVQNDGHGESVFSTRPIDLAGTNERLLSEQISALNFRLRQSNSSYTSDFHVAGDPTLLIILTGTLRVELRNGEYQDFSKGNLFIAEDFLHAETHFDETRHGHRATVIGDEDLSALHLKLEKRV